MIYTCAALLNTDGLFFLPLFFETHLSERPHARARRKKAVEEGGSATRLLRVSGLASVSVQAAWRPLEGAEPLSRASPRPMDLLRKALRDVEAAVKPRVSAARSDPNDLAGTQVVVAGRTFRVGAMFAEGGAARVYRCSSVPGGPGSLGDDGGDGTVHPLSSAPLALKQCLLPPELSDAEARHEGDVHASVSAHDDVVTLHAHDVLVPPNRRDEEGRNARGAAPPRAALLVMDLGEESLALRARRLGGLPEADALRACACVARAVAHMHARDPPVVHMDVKPENVLLFSPPRGAAPEVWRLCDFGSSVLGGDRVFSTPRERSRAESSFARTTTPTYRAPEMWDVHRPLFVTRGVGRPADVWALGCLLFELLENRPPFGAEPKLAALQGRFEWSPTVLATTNPETRALARSMLAVDPASRPSAEDAAARCAALADVADARRDSDAAADGDGVGDDTIHNVGERSGSAEKKEEFTPKDDVSEHTRDVPEPAEPGEPEEPETGWASFDPETPAESAAPRESPELCWAAFGDQGKAPGGEKKAGDDDDDDDDDVRESTGELTTGWATFS
jgi:serine/threonine protein kinase